MRKALKIIIRFQTGARGFRFFALRKGMECRINGIIPEISNDLMIIHAEGHKQMLDNYIHILKAGTPFCIIKEIITQETNFLNLTTLEISHHPARNSNCETRRMKNLSSWLGVFGLS